MPSEGPFVSCRGRIEQSRPNGGCPRAIHEEARRRVEQAGLKPRSVSGATYLNECFHRGELKWDEDGFLR